MDLNVRLDGGGTANWSTPVRVGEDHWRANFETFLLHRYTFPDGRKVYVRTRYAGVDDINTAGEVFNGFGSMEGSDSDGDWLHGKIEFEMNEPGSEDWGKAVYTFQYGTGKWEGVSGQIKGDLWAEPEKHDQEMPPPGPIRFWGFVEGEGELDLPNYK